MTQRSDSQAHAALGGESAGSAGASSAPVTMIAHDAGATAPAGGSRAPSAGSGGGSAGGAAAGAGGHQETGGSSGSAPAAGSGGAIGGIGVSAAGAGGATPCPALAYMRGNNRETLSLQGKMRQYDVYVPMSVAPDARVPLVLDFHGNTSNAMQEQSGSGWQQKADAEGFIAVFPDGYANAWNVGNCCGQALSEMIDDVGFARQIVAAVSDAACIDAKRVYATGISNGAGLAHRLACEAADVFAAIAAASADLVTDPCTPARPIAELSVRGLSDTLVAYEGGKTGSTGWYSPGAKGTLELWRKIDQCTGESQKTLEYCDTYTSCAAGVEVPLCSLPNTGHILYQNPVNFDVPKVAWDMFKRQPMP
jgi:polyhydroxybutyrate depolymerase